MESVFVLEHFYETDGKEEAKFIGVYSSKFEAEQAIERLKDKPGFRDYPDAFLINEMKLNQDSWVDGFARITYIEVKDKSGEWMTVQATCLKDNTYEIFEPHDNDSLGPFKHLDIVECEERDELLYAVKLVDKKN